MYPAAPFFAPDRAVSPAAPGSAVRLAAGIPIPLERADAGPRRALATAMVCAGVGARSQVGVIRWPLPGVHVDGIANYAAASELTGAERLLTHRVAVRHWHGKRSLQRLTRLVERCTLAALLNNPALWPELRFVALVEADGHPLTLRVIVSDGESAITTTAPAWGQVWVTGYDLALLHAATDRVPGLVEAYVWEVGQPLPGLRPIEVFDGWTYDPTDTLHGERVYHDFGLLVAAYRAHLKYDPDSGLDDRTRRRRRAAVKPNGNALVYGKAVQFSIDAGGKPARYTVDTPWGAITDRWLAEWPGEWCYPPQGAFIVSAARLILGLLLHQIERTGGGWTQCDTDGVVAHVTPGGGLEPCPGGPHRDEHGRDAVRCLSWAEFDQILRSFSTLADAVGIPTPKEHITIVNGEVRILADHPKAARSLFRIEDLNRHPDDPTLIQPGLTAISYGQKRYTVSRLHEDGTLAYDPRATYSAHGLGHTLNLSGLPERRYHYECHRTLHAWTHSIAITEPAWLDTPLLTQHAIRRPADLERYHPFTPDLCGGDVLVIAHRWPNGPELIARHPGSLASFDWAERLWIDTATGHTRRITPFTTITNILAPPSLDTDDQPPVIVHSLRGQLGSIQQGVERPTHAPNGEACTATTRGAITPTPITIAGRIVTGKESHRLTERHAGMNPPTAQTQALGRPTITPASTAMAEPGPPRTCKKPDCEQTITGRRIWCPRHAKASSTLKRSWRARSGCR
jgi:hypothetical protein